jgi:signal transduction histidine kinase
MPLTFVIESTSTAESASEHSGENVLRAIAHEIRQPLSTIESIAYYLTLVLPDNDKHREQLARVQQLVEQSNWILSNGLGLADSRRAKPETIDIEELITQTISARPPSIDLPVECELTAELPLVKLDPGYARTLIENLLGLFRQIATEAHPARLRTSNGGLGIDIDVSTTAPGYRSTASLPPGSALSLDCARRIAMMHGGSLTHSIDPLTGIRVRVMLP